MQIGILKADAIISSNFILPDEFKSLNIYQKDFKLDFSALEQRRMGYALKSALSIVNSFDLSPQELKTIPIIFSSFSGESKQCVNLLKTLKDDFVSPTAFSLSVLNATPAQMAIFYQNQNEMLLFLNFSKPFSWFNLSSCLPPSNSAFKNNRALLLTSSIEQ